MKVKCIRNILPKELSIHESDYSNPILCNIGQEYLVWVLPCSMMALFAIIQEDLVHTHGTPITISKSLIPKFHLHGLSILSKDNISYLS